MQLNHRDYQESDYIEYIQNLTKQNMEQLFIDNFGGWSDEVSKNKFFDVLKNGIVQLFFLEKVFIGYVTFNTEKNNSNTYIINDIHIVKQFQKKGYGKEILDFVVSKALQSKINNLKANVFENNPSIEFYKKNGFEKIKYLEKSNTFVMQKNII